MFYIGNLGVTLNAHVAILATLATFYLMIPVAASLGRLKVDVVPE